MLAEPVAALGPGAAGLAQVGPGVAAPVAEDARQNRGRGVGIAGLVVALAGERFPGERLYRGREGAEGGNAARDDIVAVAAVVGDVVRKEAGDGFRALKQHERVRAGVRGHLEKRRLAERAGPGLGRAAVAREALVVRGAAAEVAVGLEVVGEQVAARLVPVFGEERRRREIGSCWCCCCPCLGGGV